MEQQGAVKEQDTIGSELSDFRHPCYDSTANKDQGHFGLI
jgi:hypothetical protein